MRNGICDKKTPSVNILELLLFLWKFSVMLGQKYVSRTGSNFFLLLHNNNNNNNLILFHNLFSL